MAIIKHPNGKYSVFSTIVDDFTSINITKEQYFKMRLSEAGKELKKEVDKLFDKIDKNPELHGTIEDKLRTIESIHGKERKDKVLKLINKTG